jgi:TRAP-type C4-dicarboxylate transport system permease small subunit
MLRIIRFVEEDIPAFLLAMMVVSLSAEVFARYVIGHSIIWASEAATICFIWQVYLAAIALMRRREHISVDLFRGQLSGRKLALFDTVSVTLVIGALALTGWQAWNFVIKTNFALMPATSLSRRVLADAVLVGCIGMLIHALLHFFRSLRGLLTGDYVLPAVASPIGNEARPRRNTKS